MSLDRGGNEFLTKPPTRPYLTGFMKGVGKMAGPRQPIQLLEMKGKKHFSKAEIERRKQTEIKAPADNIKVPSWLSAKAKREFNRIASELMAIGILANIDVENLAMLCANQERYLQLQKEINRLIKAEGFTDTVQRLIRLQNSTFEVCRKGASDFGLTISSRCKLTAPPREEKQKNIVEEMFNV